MACTTRTPTRWWPNIRRALAIAGIAVALTACSADDEQTTGGRPAERDGAAIASEAGCVRCHGDEGQGGVGPPWQGLAGSTVELEDGSTVVADADYIRRAIADPGAERVAGYSARMPQLELSDQEIDALVAYIEDLG